MRSLCALLLVACLPLSSPSVAGGDADTAARTSDRMLAALVEASGVPGMGAAVVRDGRLIWSGSAGYRDLARGLPVDAQTKFRLASVSKVVTATAAAKLREQRRLDVDAPVQAMLPWLDAAWPTLTARQLAAHTSGMPHYQPVDETRGATRYATARDAVALFADRALLSPPGTAYAYSSWGYTLLSAVVEARAGQPFLDYLREHVTPGLVIGADTTDSGDPLASNAYAFVDGAAVPAPRHDYSYTWAGGGLAATPGALASFGARVMAGEVVSPQTWAWARQPTRLADGTSARERDFEVGFGWRVSRDADGRAIAHHAGSAIGARSALVLWPEQQFGIGLLSNASWVSSIEQTAMMLAAPFQADTSQADTFQTDPPPLPPRVCPQAARRYAGAFDGRPISGSAQFALKDGVCSGQVTVDNALGAWLNGFEQKDARRLEIIGLDRDGGLSRAALVTPIGLFDLRAQEDGRFAARLGATRSLVIHLVMPGSP